MFELKIEGLVGAKAFQWWSTKTISTISRKAITSTNNNFHLIVEFNDVEDPNDEYCPKIEHIYRILNFSKDFNDTDKVLIHCFAGRRRSTATAIGILIQHGMTIEDAFEHCYKIRPIMLPNRLILQLMDDALDLKGDLADYGNKWIQAKFTNKEHMQQDYLQDISEMQRILNLMKGKS